MINFFRTYQGYKKFNSLPKEQKEIVFYSEGDFQWQFFEGIIDILCKEGYKVCYITSDKKDRGYNIEKENLSSFYIGHSWVRTLFFLNLDSKILLMSMPDLDVYHIKKSKVANVHYVYIFHACVSTHMMYRPQAFDNFDSIFCVGLHHISEIRKREEMFGLKKKNLIEHGYVRIDNIIKANQEQPDSNIILIAPSWGENALIETGECKKIIKELLNDNWQVILRPHPETKKLSADLISDIRNDFQSNKNFTYDDDIHSSDSLKQSSLMITDSSGIIFDYALGYLKPIIFIKKCYKIKNKNYLQLAIDPVEISIRKEVGIDYKEGDYKNLSNVIKRYIANYNSDIQKMEKIREQYIFNIGNSAEIGADQIIKLLTII